MTENALARATERLNATIDRAERVLAGLAFGVSATIELISPHDDQRRVCVRFAKKGSEWRLFVVHGDEREPGADVQEMPVRSASRWTRVLVLRHLPRLVEALQEAAALQATELDQDLEDAALFLDRVEARSG